ncbi:MAG: antitoxin family protein [Halobacteriota archaeon]
MQKTIEGVYEDGVFKPLEKVEIRRGERVKIEIKANNLESIVDASFGLLKGKDTLKALEETEDEWGFC